MQRREVYHHNAPSTTRRDWLPMDALNSTPLKQCSKCKKFFPAAPEYFYHNKRAKDRLRYSCRACDNAQCMQWRRDNRDKVLATRKRHYWKYHDRHIERGRRYAAENSERGVERARGWNKRNPERAKLSRNTAHLNRRALKSGAPGKFGIADIRLQIKAQGGNCWWCGKKLDDKYEVDHRIPLARGGSNDPGNLVLSCPRCNRKKGAKLPYEWNGRLL